MSARLFHINLARSSDDIVYINTYKYCNNSAPYCHLSPAFLTSIRALFTKALMSSSNALRSCSDTFGSPRFRAVESRRAGRDISSSNSWRTSGCRASSEMNVEDHIGIGRTVPLEEAVDVTWVRSILNSS